MPRSILPILCTLALVPVLLWLGGGTEISSGLLRALPSIGLAWLWWLAARGYGHWLLPGSSEMRPVVGVVGLVFLDQCLGRLGLMDLTSAWGLLALGLLGYRRSTTPPNHLRWPQMEWTWVLPLAVLGAAALVPPGWLWDTEFGGYDVLSYHLALPTDWWTLGRMGPLTTNAYSGLPNAAESAFLHLHALSAGNHDVTGLAAQLLCAILMLHTASLLHKQLPAAALVFLMTPWVMVTGSMAYTEAFVLLPAGALLLHLRASQGSEQAVWDCWRAGSLWPNRARRCCWHCRSLSCISPNPSDGRSGRFSDPLALPCLLQPRGCWTTCSPLVHHFFHC